MKKIFIANRGEIARRISITASRMGIKSVCVLEKSELPPLFLLESIDEFVLVEQETRALFLNHELMIKHAQESGCDALHPGFGFLSENADFAQKVENAGLLWIGPPVAAMKVMADKHSARNIAKKCGVPCLTGFDSFSYKDQKALARLEEFSQEASYPLLIKAVMGGGGKGMRLVRDKSQVMSEAKRAASEAEQSFGSDLLLIERYIEKGRHVEVQILGDQAGKVLAIGDRDCSLQRRHQKIIEEAPAPFLPQKLKEELHAYSRKLASHVGYYSTGTVEFIVDSSHPDEKHAFFLEMNTRLQVEHPVSEEVYGLDLVEWQLRVARGEKLPFDEKKITEASRHSIEARVYAEDPEENFLPSPGKIDAFLPFHGPGIRWEQGVDFKSEVTSQFDPMIAKVVATGNSRTEAIQRLKHALASTLLVGPKNNVEFLQEILESEEFQSSRFTTQSMEKTFPQLRENLKEKREQYSSELKEVFEKLMALGVPAQSTQSTSIETRTKSIFSKKSLTTFKSDTVKITASFVEQDFFVGFLYDAEQKKKYRFLRKKTEAGNSCFIAHNGHLFKYTEKVRSWHGASASENSDHEILSPLPGKLLHVFFSTGGNVKKDQVLCIIESMKMELEIKAKRAGVIKKALVKEGSQVSQGEVLGLFD